MRKIYIFFGKIASGKSTLAQRFAERHRFPYYNTDRVRKELAGLAPTSKRNEAIEQGIYSREFTRKTYRTMVERAGDDLREGRSGVVLDGSYQRRHERDEVREMAAGWKADCMFIQCACSDEETMRRLLIRSGDPESVSDGRWEIYQVQKKSFEPPDELSSAELIEVDTEGRVEILLDRLDAILDMKNS